MSNDNNLDEALSLNGKLITMVQETIIALRSLQSGYQEVFDRIEALETSTRNEIREMREEIERLKLGKG